MKEQRYILDFAITQQFEGEKEIIPSLNGKFVKNKESFFNVSLSANKLYENDWRNWGFERAVMNSEFRDNDCFSLPYPYGMLISERLKNALEAAKPALTGFEITPFPVEFEYL